jgi:hypothetical protein
MRVSGGVAPIALAMIVAATCFPGAVRAQTPKTWNEHARRDRETRLMVFYVYDTMSPTLCRNSGRPTLTLVEPPRNGSARFEETDYTPQGCPNPIKATGVFYRPNPGFTGTDRFTAVKGPQGKVLEIYEGTNVFSVTVK